MVSPAKYQAWLAGHTKKTPAVALAAAGGASPVPAAVAGQAAASGAPGLNSPAGLPVGPVGGAPPSAAGTPAAAPAAQTGPLGTEKVAPAKPAAGAA